ncbi:MAG: shikimate dehydrogenase, partial [Clostridia bacterium]|nr:shikimate dehydrogenase [Clostridia bacterium]
MAKLAVIGKDVSQSTSPQMHLFIARELGLEMTYERISVDESAFEERIEKLLKEYDGLNVTIPYKLSVISRLKKTEGDATAFGAVNTVLASTLTGYNTDGLGFMQMLGAEGVDASGKEALVLGAGGAGRSVAKKLADCGARVEVYDRNAENSRGVASEFNGVEAVGEVLPKKRYLIINATGVGMHKTVGISPVGEEILAGCEVAVDLIYVPEKSEFLRLAEGLGKK